MSATKTHGGKRRGAGRKRMARGQRRSEVLALSLRPAQLEQFGAAAAAQGKRTATWAVDELDAAAGVNP